MRRVVLVLVAACGGASDATTPDAAEPSRVDAGIDPAVLARRVAFRQLADLVAERSVSAPLACTYRDGQVDRDGHYRVTTRGVTEGSLDFHFDLVPVAGEDAASVLVTFEARGALSARQSAGGTTYTLTLEGVVTDELVLGHNGDKTRLDVRYEQAMDGSAFDWIRCQPHGAVTARRSGS